MKKQIILLLAANPTGTDPRALDHDWGCGCPVGDEHPRWFEALHRNALWAHRPTSARVGC